MIKLFFLTFFMAELIIASAIILKIHKINRKVNRLNQFFEGSKNDIIELFVDVRFLLKTFNDGVEQIRQYVQQKKQEYIIRITKKMVIFFGFLSLNNKYKKIILAYELGKEIYQEFKEENTV